MRRGKTGLDYFPVDIDFFNDEKIEFVSAKHGVLSELITLRLLSRIYRNGYFIEWSEDAAYIYSKQFGEGISHEFLTAVVEALVARRFFNREKYEKYGILTSKGIQVRYLEAVKRRKQTEIIDQYLLISKDNVNIINSNVSIISLNANTMSTETPENVNSGTQSKVKESKVKKRSNILGGKPPLPETPDTCPQNEIKNLYHETLPELPKVRVWSEKNQGYLRSRWKSDKEYQSLDWWKDFFLRVKKSDFLAGRTKEEFTPDLEWLVTSANFTKILNGRYDNRGSPLKGKVSDITTRNIQSFQEWEPPEDGKEMFS